MLLTNDDGLRRRLAERVKYVIVDEYQDVNPVQEAIVWSLHELGASICVVGDDDQTIYQWRGSDVENILTFAERYPAVEQIPLEENFRSSEGIVETARDFIEQNSGAAAEGDEADRARRPTSRATSSRCRSTIRTRRRSYIARDDRRRFGASRSRRTATKRGLSWSDMAVLLRSVKANGEPITRGASRRPASRSSSPA